MIQIATIFYFIFIVLHMFLMHRKYHKVHREADEALKVIRAYNKMADEYNAKLEAAKSGHTLEISPIKPFTH